MSAQERFEFACKVAESLMDELNRTAIIMEDIEALQRYIQRELTQEQVDHMRYA
jgi:hypothetical protein